MIINGKEIATALKEKIKARIEENARNGIEKPNLACVLVGDDEASALYIRNKAKACAQCGITSNTYVLPENTTKESLLRLVHSLNKSSADGILVQLPLPSHLKKYEKEIINAIRPDKDVDCLTEANIGKLVGGTADVFPCTASGIMKILDTVGVDLEGKRVCVLGRSLLVGQPVALMAQQRNATVTVCHSRTADLKSEVLRADVVISAMGRPKAIPAEYIKEGAIVIDAGTIKTEEGLVGDVDFASCKDKCSMITPVPGGVGPLTVACLMENTLILSEKHHEKELNRESKKSV